MVLRALTWAWPTVECPVVTDAVIHYEKIIAIPIYTWWSTGGCWPTSWCWPTCGCWPWHVSMSVLVVVLQFFCYQKKNVDIQMLTKMSVLTFNIVAGIQSFYCDKDVAVEILTEMSVSQFHFIIAGMQSFHCEKNTFIEMLPVDVAFISAYNDQLRLINRSIADCYNECSSQSCSAVEYTPSGDCVIYPVDPWQHYQKIRPAPGTVLAAKVCLNITSMLSWFMYVNTISKQ